MWSLQSLGLIESNKHAQKEVTIKNLKCMKEEKRAHSKRNVMQHGTQEESNIELRFNSYHRRTKSG